MLCFAEGNVLKERLKSRGETTQEAMNWSNLDIMSFFFLRDSNPKVKKAHLKFVI